MAVERIQGRYVYDSRVKATLKPGDKKKLLEIKELTGVSESSIVADAVSEYIKRREPKNSY